MRKLRFAIAITALPATLAAVAIALAEIGVARENMHLVGQDDTLAAASRELALSGYPQRLTEIARCMTYQDTATDHAWVMELLAASAAADGRTARAPPLSRLGSLRSGGETHHDPLDRRLENGSGVVIVRLDAETSEQDVCGLMLRYHSASVQTHDLRSVD